MRTSSVSRITALLFAFVLTAGPHALAKSTNSDIVLPEGYKNDDIVVLYNDLKQKYPPKDEFETQAAYEKRMRVEYEGKTKYFFVKEILEGGVAKGAPGYNYLKYDAENQIITLKRVLKLFDGKVKIKRTKYSREEYEAVNGFGAKAIVTSHSGIDYGILVENQSDLIKEIDVSLSPSDARALKENLGLLFVCEIKKDNEKGYLKKGFTYKRAEFRSPRSYAFPEQYVRVEVIEIVIFNRETGFVYATQAIKAGN